MLTSSVVTVGSFDGVHRGHRSLLERLSALSAQEGGESVVATFDPHPRKVIGNDPAGLKLLNTPQEKALLLQQAGISALAVFPFTQAFSRQDEHSFIRRYLVEYLKVRCLVIGYNHRFGHRRNGSFASLQDYGQRYGFTVEEMPRLDAGAEGISSTLIRRLIAEGRVAEANAWLGYRYPLSGKVGKGRQRGRLLGFPTANLVVDHPDKLVPGRGVYIVSLQLRGQSYYGLCNIGTNPTFGQNEETIEVHVLGFEGDLYNNMLQIQFEEKIRNEERFTSGDRLVQQMTADRETAQRWIQQNKKGED